MIEFKDCQQTTLKIKALSDSSIKGRKWVFKDQNDRNILILKQKYNYPEILAQLISQRCPETTDSELFLAPKLKNFLPNPFILKDMDKAVSRIVKAINNKEKITIFGDYDVDGATSTALLIKYLNYFQAQVDFYIPDRIKEGYGPSVKAFQNLKGTGTQLIITVDCGTSAHVPLQSAKEMGIDVIVIDHHIPESTLPDNYAIVNPNQKEDRSGYGYLCAAGVTFLVIVALQSELKNLHTPCPDLKTFLDLVALATVCDVVPLKGLNRAFVQQGLFVLNKQLNPGIKALCHVAKIDGKCTAYHLGYILGPHINAGGRIGTSTLGTQLLTALSMEEALPIAEKLHQLNKERKEIEAKALQQAISMAAQQQNTPIVCLGMDEWHPGIIGIIAGRLKELFYKPVFVIAFDETGVGKGSGRSIPGVNLGLLVQHAKEAGLLLNGGGHAMAAGLTIEKHKFPELKSFFLQSLPLDPLPPSLEIDTTLHIRGITMEIAQLINQVGPFGAENPAPIFMIPYCQIIKSQLRGEKHISCFLRSECGKFLEAIAFNAVGTPLENVLMSTTPTSYHIAGTLKVDTWQGRDKIKFHIEDISL